MEKVLWINSSAGIKKDDGLEEVNKLLNDGWTVKLISACATNNMNFGQAYIVIEKKLRP